LRLYKRVDEMYLTKEEEKMLDGEYGEGYEKAMRILVVLGDIYGAERMIPISSSQISGISYKSIGDAGLEFLEDFANSGVKVKVTATMNPAGMDLEDWQKMGVSKEFAEKQIRIVNALKRIGVVPIPSCTPYFHGFYPRFGEHVAWAESSAVIFVNSVIGARTNREGGPSALAAAITGRTPYYGLHIPENRYPNVEFKINFEPRGRYEFSLIGYYIGMKMRKGIPFITGLKSATIEELRSMGAGMASSGSIALYHVEKITPEANNVPRPKERIEIEKNDLEEVIQKLNTSDTDIIDLVAFGCPHLNLKEVLDLYAYFKESPPKTKVWICTSSVVKSYLKSKGITDELEKMNVLVLADTCMVVAPLEQVGVHTIGLDSTKAAHYTNSLTNIKVKLAEGGKLI